MKRTLKTVFACSLAGAVITALAFINNLVAIIRWWRAFAAAGGDTAQVPAHAEGCFAFLDWSAVDYSAVTTFIPLLGFICLTRSAWLLLHNRRHAPDDFPFFKGSDQLNVALGLFGTLWGIIVIGYFRLDTVQMADLMQCLHTALFSTLMAVVWVFLIDRPLIRPYFLKLLTRTNLAEAEEGDLAAAVGLFVERLNAASEEFNQRQIAYEAAFTKRMQDTDAALNKRLSEADAALNKWRSETDAAQAKRIAETDAAINKWISAAEASFARREAEYQQAFEKRQREYVEFFRRQIAEQEHRAVTSEKKLRAVVEALQE